MSNVATDFWSASGTGKRIVVLLAAALCLTVLAWVAFKAVHEEYKVLFSDLAASDAAAIVARLKNDKVPYRLVNSGTGIAVPAGQVHEVRLDLMSGDLPLSGGVGFEIFDKQGLGTTEHSQKVSYQRALQGELSRTIGSLDGVKHVRVHLVMPESTLFTRDRQLASAAVAVAMKPGSVLERQQIAGVQRLVAAAVPGLDPARVVITDQRGVTLTSPVVGTPESGAGPAADVRLQVKREIEEYVTQKIGKLLDGAFGPGQAIISVDATVNFDATKTVIQDLIPASGDAAAGEGRVVRRRQVTGASGSEPMWATISDGAAARVTPSSSSEIEYQYGRRIDEIIAAPGAVTRMSIGVVVPDDVTDEGRARIAELVRMAAGIDEDRGDAVSVQALHQIADSAHLVDLEDESGDDDTRAASDAPPSPVKAASFAGNAREQMIVALAAAATLGGLLALLIAVAVRRARSAANGLSADARQKMLEEIREALSEEAGPPAGRGSI